jgi:hypothetical protein
MRCITCGDDMVLTQALPAEAGFVDGFVNQTLECPGCGETERRFTFAGGVAGFAVSKMSTPTEPRRNRKTVDVPADSRADNRPVHQDCSVNHVILPTEEKSSAGRMTEMAAVPSHPPVIRQAVKASAPNNASAQAWVRVVDKVRSYQAGLNRSVGKAKTKSEPELDNASTRFIASAHEQAPCAADPLWSAPPLQVKRTRPPGSPKVVEPGKGAIRSFDEVWDGLLPARNGGYDSLEVSVAASSLAALPRSLSLAVVEPPTIGRGMQGGNPVPKTMLEKLFRLLESAVSSR